MLGVELGAVRISGTINKRQIDGIIKNRNGDIYGTGKEIVYRI